MVFCPTMKHRLDICFLSQHSKPEWQASVIVLDVAAIAALRPEGIYFGYVDEATLQTDIKGAERDTTFKSSHSKHITVQGPAPDASVGGLTGTDRLGSRHPDDLPLSGHEVLFFEFVDGKF